MGIISKLLPYLVGFGVGVMLFYGLIKYGENQGQLKEEIRSIEAESTIRDRVIQGVRDAPKGVEESLEYLRNRK